ncbi:acetyltransferase (GNAT) family protein [Hasllibacter halocynthiae]|uniref:Acetyltransferase (GNAT) family protein n=1 Tax=Hasllibacter halocynthiae TaxID=595589 RepID=A0A2T0X346_9RHOB|nr:GNAT family N-acetyltransferase [Hasllibacter halocynthiae]PRY93360.1 acetyltransferase (GNAT) family protein [Hasllibacter halocynthiae]
MTREVRRPGLGEPARIARMWHDAWHDSHGGIVPLSLVRARTREEFTARTYRSLGPMRVIGPEGAPDGLCIVRGNELDQLYLAKEARGTGAADALMRDAERRLPPGIAFLLVAERNARAVRFYERHGWTRVRAEIGEAKLADGTGHPLRVWRYEKAIP